MLPEALVRLDPVVHRPEFLAVQAVHTTPAFPHDADQADFAEHAEVLGDLRLGPADLRDEPGDVTPTLAVGDGAEDLASPRLGDGSERVGGRRRACHARNIFRYGNMSSAAAIFAKEHWNRKVQPGVRPGLHPKATPGGPGSPECQGPVSGAR